MFKDDKRVRMFCGHYGSGKTEFAGCFGIGYIGLYRDKCDIECLDR